MAFEVARVHELICSRVGDEGVFKYFQDQNASVEADQASALSCSPLGAQLHKHYPMETSYNFRDSNQWCENNSLPSELSPCSTETESDEEDNLLLNLAQQIAHSMLDEEKSTDMCAGVRQGSGYSEAQNLPNADMNEGRLSPSCWSSGSWSSGSLLSGSRDSSKGSSRVSSQVSSPSSAPSSGYQDAWDTLYAAAGEVVRLKMNEDKKVERPSHPKVVSPAMRTQLPQQSRPSGQLAGRSSPHYARRKDENLMTINQAQQTWALKCEAMNAMANQGQAHRMQYQQHHPIYYPDGHQGANNFCHPGKMGDGNTLQRTRQAVLNRGSGVRVVFLGASSGRESGTGVFLPRTFEPKKKNEASPMTTPTHGRVTGVQRQSKSPREGVWPTLQQSMNRPGLRDPVHDPCLPTKWTY